MNSLVIVCILENTNVVKIPCISAPAHTIIVSIFLPLKSRSRSWSTIFAMRPNIKIYKSRVMQFYASSNNFSDINA